MGAVAVLCLTFGALNAALAITVGTCTQGDAGELLGGWITLLLYLVGTAALLVARRKWICVVLLAPAAAIALVHSWFAIRLTYSYLVHGVSACFVLAGEYSPQDSGEWMDGGEPVYIALWLGLSALFWFGYLNAMRLARAEGPRIMTK